MSGLDIPALAAQCRNTTVRITKIYDETGAYARGSWETNFAFPIFDLIDEYVLDRFDLGPDGWTSEEDEDGEYIACRVTGRRLGHVDVTYSNAGLMETHPRAAKHLESMMLEAAE